MKKSKKNLVHSLIYVCISLGIAAISAYHRGLFQMTDPVEMTGILSDCFLFPAILFGGLGALTWIAAQGTFDMLSYGFYAFFTGMFRPGKKSETFYEYKLRKEEKGSGWNPGMFLVGMFFLAASVVCAVIYMQAY